VYPDSNNVRLAVTGVPNTGTVSLPVTYTSGGTRGWNLVGNPYPSPISWNSGAWTKTNIDNAIYLWDPLMGKAGSYYTYVNGVASDGRTNGDIIPSFQGFFVKANAASPLLQTAEAIKTGTAHTQNFRTESISDLLRLKLTYDNSLDYAVLYLQDGATKGFDKDFDALKLMGSEVNLFTAANLEAYSIQALGANADTFSIPLHIKTAFKGIHKIEVSQFISQINKTLYLLDVNSNKVKTLDSGATYTFDPAVSTKLRISNYIPNNVIANLGEKDFEGTDIRIFPNPTSSNFTITSSNQTGNLKSIEVYSIEGTLIFKKELSGGSVHILDEASSLAQGMYLVKVITDKSKCYKMVSKE